jgi:hypothetical protein
MITYIYILICPIDQEIKYVGKANNPQRRLRDHMKDFRSRLGEFKKTAWLLKLYQQGLKPDMEIVDEVEIDKWKEMESFWIAYFKSIGCNLLNSGKGGNGLSVATNTSFQVGQKPWNKGLKIKK